MRWNVVLPAVGGDGEERDAFVKTRVLEWIGKPQTKYIILVLGMVFLGTSLIWDLGANVDIYHVLNTGRFIWENGFTREEPFSMHEGLSYLPQQWLSAAIFYAVWSVSGYLGLAIFLYLILAVAVWVAVLAGCMQSGSKVGTVHVVVAILVFLPLCLTVGFRPRVFDALAFSCTMYLIQKARIQKDARYLVPIPFLSCALINLHASMWPIIFMVGGGFFLAALVRKEFRFAGRLALTGAASAVVLLCNPYGIDAVLYIFRSMSPLITQYIGECQPLIEFWFSLVGVGPYFAFVSIVIILIVVGLALSIVFVRRGDIWLPVLWAIFAAFALWSFRNSFFVLLVVLALASQWASVFFRDEKSRFDGNVVLPVGLSLVFLFSGFFASPLVKGRSAYEIVESNSGAFIVEDAMPRFGKEVSDLDVYAYDGSYLEFAYRIPCYYDGRAEVFLESLNGRSEIRGEIVGLGRREDQGRTVSFDDESLRSFIEKYWFDYLVLSNGGLDDAIDTHLMHAAEGLGYQTVYEDEGRKVMARPE
ncbi:hypothetical protein B5F40_04060 [Gordonibacter sp. An230]|nr:hypothetical protein B5F40_04060 [Gordonibacter sp. An230]